MKLRTWLGSVFQLTAFAMLALQWSVPKADDTAATASSTIQKRASDALPTVEHIMELRRNATGTTGKIVRTTGRIRIEQIANRARGMDGKYVAVSAGADRFRLDIDFGRSRLLQVVRNNGRMWVAVSGGTPKELTGEDLREFSSAVAAHSSDWLKYYDAVRVLRAVQVEARKVYVVQLEAAGLPPNQVSVDAQTGDLLEFQQTLGARVVVVEYSDFRVWNGSRISYRSISTVGAKRTVFEADRVEILEEVSPDTFGLPSGGLQL